MTNQGNKTEPEVNIKLTYKLILAYERDNPAKAMETLNLITATRQYLENHFKDKDDKGKKIKPLSYGQIRNILLEVRKHENNLSRIIPTLAYMEAKLDEENQKDLVKFIRELLENSIQSNRSEVFIEYMDLLVAYHKYYSTSKK